MALQDPQAEPSMEEILASIRRIISEEDDAPPEAGAIELEEEVLDLTQPAPAPEPAAAQDDDDLVFENELIEEPVLAAPEPAPEPVPAPAPVQTVAPSAPAPTVETIVSQPSAHAAAEALTRLAGQLRIADTPGQTLEGVVRELLKPMLKDWLDENLPRIVEARVEAELERIARLAR
jgi:uncharacterized protein